MISHTDTAIFRGVGGSLEPAPPASVIVHCTVSPQNNCYTCFHTRKRSYSNAVDKYLVFQTSFLILVLYNSALDVPSDPVNTQVTCHLSNVIGSWECYSNVELVSQRTLDLRTVDGKHKWPTYVQVPLPGLRGRDSWVGVMTRYGPDGPRFESQWGRDFSHPSRPALRPTQPPIQWVPGLSRGKAAGTWR